jgi:hypothetical protein
VKNLICSPRDVLGSVLTLIFFSVPP